MNTFKRYTLTEIKEAHASIDGHFFSKKAMKVWNSHIESVPNKANIFITSEKEQDWHKRRYTLRWFNPKTSQIENLGPFMAYDNIDDARLGRKRWSEVKFIQFEKANIDLQRAKSKVLEEGKALFPVNEAIEVSNSLAEDGIENYALLYTDTHLMVELKIEEEN